MKVTERFSSRVENYVQFRPHYPKEILLLLQRECGLKPTSRIADVGSGTGILSKLFLEFGCEVIGIEPNALMREAGENFLTSFLRFHSVDAMAEATGLENQSVNFITAGQSFHWFDRSKIRSEFQRILKPDGYVVLIWNDRRTDSSPFLRAYEKLLQNFATDYTKVDHKQIDAEVIRSFFAPNKVQFARFENKQSFDFEGLKGRVLSSSYAPETGEKSDAMLLELKSIFWEHQTANRIAFEYDTIVYFVSFHPQK